MCSSDLYAETVNTDDALTSCQKYLAAHIHTSNAAAACPLCIPPILDLGFGLLGKVVGAKHIKIGRASCRERV